MLKINFLGDISFNDKGKEDLLKFDAYNKLVKENDFSIANLEALASIGEFNLLKKPRVTTSLETLNKLSDLKINLVTLAHNHVYDTKLSGFSATIGKLKQLGIDYIGAGISQEDASKPYVLEKDDLKIGFLNYCTADTNPSLPENCPVFMNWYSIDQITSDVHFLKNKIKCDHIVLLLHWGGKYEGGYFPGREQLIDVKKLVKLDISLIVGHHSHTLQPNCRINNKLVYFSLGNFIFYDVRHDGRSIKLSKRRKKGGVLSVLLSNQDIESSKLWFTEQKTGNLEIYNHNTFHGIRNLVFKYFKRWSLFWVMYDFQFKRINPILYFVFVKDGGLRKYKSINLKKVKNILWKK